MSGLTSFSTRASNMGLAAAIVAAGVAIAGGLRYEGEGRDLGEHVCVQAVDGTYKVEYSTWNRVTREKYLVIDSVYEWHGGHFAGPERQPSFNDPPMIILDTVYGPELDSGAFEVYAAPVYGRIRPGQPTPGNFWCLVVAAPDSIHDTFRGTVLGVDTVPLP